MLMTATSAPRSFASMAALRPEMPPPRTRTSCFSKGPPLRSDDHDPSDEGGQCCHHNSDEEPVLVPRGPPCEFHKYHPNAVVEVVRAHEQEEVDRDKPPARHYDPELVRHHVEDGEGDEHHR